MTRLFLYGTLRRGGSAHHRLAGQRFLGEARTAGGYGLFRLSGYPGLVPVPEHVEGVVGEVWEVDAAALARLDAYEGVSEGLYRRETVPLRAPFDGAGVEAYVYARPVTGRAFLGSEWPLG
jgi:gamma-glutamylaminecyclotransferase